MSHAERLATYGAVSTSLALLSDHRLSMPRVWQASGPFVVWGEVSWICPRIMPRPTRQARHFTLEAVVQLMATPDPYAYSCGIRLSHTADGVGWEEPTCVDAYEPIMSDVKKVLLGEAAPFFRNMALLKAIWIICTKDEIAHLSWRRGVVSVDVDEEIAYVHLMRGDLPSAMKAADYAERAVEMIENRRLSRRRELDVVERVRHVMRAARRDPDEAMAILRANAKWSAA